MAVPILMPKLGLTMEEGTIVQWYRADGDSIQRDEPVLEISTEKVNVDVEAPATGILRNLQAGAGDTVAVGHTLAFVVTTEEEINEPAASPSDQAEAGSSPEGDIRPTPVAARLAREHDIDLADVPPSGAGGRITKADVEAYLRERDAGTATSSATREQGRTLATPAARRLAHERGIDLDRVAGNGPDGLIIERDIAAVVADAGGPLDAPPIRERLRLEGRRKVIATRMQQSARDIPHIQLSVDVDVTHAEEKRGEASLTALIAQVTAQTLVDHPMLNAWLQDDEILVFDTVNLGVAVDTDDGLIVPVVHDAQTRSLGEMDAAIRELSRRARADESTFDDVSAGTFTISNLGMLGIDRFEAIINPPQAAILAVGRVRLQPWAPDTSTVTVSPIMTVTVSADHRIVDGAVVARFLQDLKSRFAQ